MVVAKSPPEAMPLFLLQETAAWNREPIINLLLPFREQSHSLAQIKVVMVILFAVLFKVQQSQPISLCHCYEGSKCCVFALFFSLQRVTSFYKAGQKQDSKKRNMKSHFENKENNHFKQSIIMYKYLCVE